MIEARPVTRTRDLDGVSFPLCRSNHYSYTARAIIAIVINPGEYDNTKLFLCRDCAINLSAMLEKQAQVIEDNKI